MAKIFVSYSRKDIEFAKRLTAELQKSDLDFWIDWEGIPPTVDWWKEIEKGIEEADIFVFLISPDSAKSKVCGQEIDVAVKNGKRIIPIVVREIEWQDTPSQLGHLNYIFFSRDDDFDVAVKKLLTAIHTDYEWAATHRRLQVKALEWDREKRENSFLLRGKDLQEAELQLTTNSSKNPHPTDLQREYVFTSRKAVERQRRLTTTISIAAAIALAILAVFGFYQASVARKAQATAEAQSRIALNRQWAAEAQALLADPAGNVETATLLSLRALESGYTSEADAALTASLKEVHSIKSFRSGTYATWTAFSSDGKTILVGNADSTVGVFDANTGSQLVNWNLYNVPGNGPGGYSSNDQVVFSSDGRTVLIGNGNTSSALVFDVSSGKLLQTFYMHAPNEWVNSVAIAPDGKTIVTGNTDGTTRLWETSAGTQLQVFGKPSPYTGNANEWQSTWVNRVTYSPDGNTILTGDAQGVVHLWDISSGSELHTFQGHSGAITSLAFSPDGKTILTGGEDRTARLWDATTGDPISIFTGHTGAVSSVAFSPDGRMILTGSADATARLWDIATKTQLQVYAGHTSIITSVVFSPDGKFVLTGSADQTARLWETNPQMGKFRTFGGHTSPITSVAFSPDGKMILAGAEDHVARLWNIATGVQVLSLEGHSRTVTSVAFAPDGKKILTGSEDNTAHLWNAQTGKEVLILTGHTDWITGVAFSPDSKKVLTGSYDGTARLWDAETGAQLMVFGKPANTQTTSDRYNDSITSVAFSPDGKNVVTGSFGNSVKVWDANTGKMLLDFSSCMASSIAVAPNGKSILVGCNSDEGTFLLDATVNADTAWQTGKADLMNFTHPPAPITSVAFSPLGNMVLTGGQDKITRLWDTNTGKEIRTLVLQSDVVMSVAFSPDGKFILTGSADGTVQLWDTDYHDTIKMICSAMTRDLTTEERTKYNIPDNNATCPNLPIPTQPIGG